MPCWPAHHVVSPLRVGRLLWRPRQCLNSTISIPHFRQAMAWHPWFIIFIFAYRFPTWLWCCCLIPFRFYFYLSSPPARRPICFPLILCCWFFLHHQRLILVAPIRSRGDRSEHELAQYITDREPHSLQHHTPSYSHLDFSYVWDTWLPCSDDMMDTTDNEWCRSGFMYIYTVLLLYRLTIHLLVPTSICLNADALWKLPCWGLPMPMAHSNFPSCLPMLRPLLIAPLMPCP